MMGGGEVRELFSQILQGLDGLRVHLRADKLLYDFIGSLCGTEMVWRPVAVLFALDETPAAPESISGRAAIKAALKKRR